MGQALGIACGLAIWAGAALAQAPTAPGAPRPAAPGAAPGAVRPTVPPAGTGGAQARQEGFSIVQDERLYQLEEVISLIAGSVGKVADKVKTLAINSFYFGHDVDPDFRRKAEIIIMDRLLNANPNVRLIQCQECQRLETKIVRGILRLRKGIPSGETRRELAKTLGADGFIDIGLFQSGGQMTVYLKVVEAESGAIILVDELAGRVAFKRRALTFSFGDMTFPIKVGTKTVQHNALVLGVSESAQLTGRFSFTVDLAAYADNNELNTSKYLTLDAGLVLRPTLGFDILQMPSSTSRLLFYLGVGKLLSPQLNYATLFSTGLQYVVGDRLVVQFGVNSFPDTNVKVASGSSAATLTGVGNELRFGYRF